MYSREIKITSLCKNCPAFRESIMCAFDEDELNEIADSILPISFNKKHNLITENKTAPGAYCVRSGIIKLHKVEVEPRHITIGFKGRGNLIGYYGLLQEHNPFNATCLTNVEACFIPKKLLAQKHQRSLAFSQRINSLLLNDLKDLVDQHITGITKNTRDRLLEHIINLENKFGTDTEGFIALPLTRQELAEMMGASLESVFRILAILKRNKLIVVKRGKIKIVDISRLNSFSRIGNN